ncbi:MAG: hypothetical protein ACE5EE_05085 [Fidelibacterota bacterium]
MIKDLIRKNRSYRRFYQEDQIDKKTLEGTSLTESDLGAILK